MQNKESAVAVMTTIMLVAISLPGGFATSLALATHDPDAIQVTTKQFSKEDHEITETGVIEFTAKAAVPRERGAIVVAMVQDDGVLATDSISASDLSTTYSEIDASFDIEVTG